MQTNTIHTVTDAQRNAFTNFINFYLRHDQDLKHVMPAKPQKLGNSLQDGTLINLAVPGTILNDAINFPQGKQMNVFKKRQNHNLAIASARSIGIVTTNISAQSLVDQRQHIMLGLTWQTIEVFIFKDINLRKCPQIMVLKEQHQQQEHMLKLQPRSILLRWLNWHLKQNHLQKRVRNFHKDLKDIQAYLAVFNDISKIDEKAYTYSVQKRASHVIQLAQKQKINTFVRTNDLIQGSQRLNILFCSLIFNHKNGLKYEGKRMPFPIDQDDNDSRELRIYKTWINSMGLQDGHVVNLVQDLKTGVILLKLIDFMKPKTVDWQKAVTTKLDNRIFCNQNCKYAVQLIARSFDIKVVGITGPEIVDGKTYAILGILWQLYRINSLGLIGDMKQQQLIQWGNQKSQVSIKNLKDKTLQDSMYWLKLIASLDNRIVNFSVVKEKGQQGWKQYNAKYALASARKMGAQVIILWQHISQINPKFLMIFLADIYRVGNKKK